MAGREDYYVVGGEFTDTSWQGLRGQPQIEGPFDNYADALSAWRAGTAQNVDDCHHRLFILRASDVTAFAESLGIDIALS